MGCVSSKNKNKITILIINKLPKNTKLSSEIVLEKDADLNSLFCDVNIFGYFPTTIRLYPEDKSPPTPDFSNLNSIDSRIELFFSFKEMIQLVACWCLLNLEFLVLNKKIFMKILMKFMLHLVPNTRCLKIVLGVLTLIHHLTYHVNVWNSIRVAAVIVK